VALLPTAEGPYGDIFSKNCVLVSVSYFVVCIIFQFPVLRLVWQVPREAAASVCFKTGLAHLELNHLSDALSCFDEAFLALAKEQSRGSDIKAQATICAQYKITVTLLRVLLLCFYC